VHTSTASYNFVMWCLIKQNNDCIYFLIWLTHMFILLHFLYSVRKYFRYFSKIFIYFDLISRKHSLCSNFYALWGIFNAWFFKLWELLKYNILYIIKYANYCSTASRIIMTVSVVQFLKLYSWYYRNISSCCGNCGDFAFIFTYVLHAVITFVGFPLDYQREYCW
jgi:hypothetical protein